MDKIYSECLQAKRTRHRVVKHDERRGQLSARRIAPTGWSMKSLVVCSSHLCWKDCDSFFACRYVLFNEYFSVEKHKEVSFLYILGLNCKPALHD